jgi:hypothetical protein
VPSPIGTLAPVTPVRFRRTVQWSEGIGGLDTTPASAASVLRPQASPRKLPPGRARVGLSVEGDTQILPLYGLMARGGQPRHRGLAALDRILWQSAAVVPQLALMVRGGQPRRRGSSSASLAKVQALSTWEVYPPGWGTSSSVLRPIFVRLQADIRSRMRPGFRPVGPPPGAPSPPPFVNRFGSVHPVTRLGDRQARMRPRGMVRFLPIGIPPSLGQVEYHIYANTGIGDPINYHVPVATTLLTTWTSFVLAHPGDWKFGVRAFWSGTGLEEGNLDCAVEIILDGSGNDITNRPGPPTGLRAFATRGGGITVEWHYNQLTRPPANAQIASRGMPTGFHVYKGTGGVPNYASPAATVLFGTGFLNNFRAALSGLTDGTAYTIGVRAYNATAEEQNTTTVTVTADASGPTAVLDLTAIAIV